MDTNDPILVTVTNISIDAQVGAAVDLHGLVSATQHIASVKLLVEGFAVAKAVGPQVTLKFESRESV